MLHSANQQMHEAVFDKDLARQPPDYTVKTNVILVSAGLTPRAIKFHGFAANKGNGGQRKPCGAICWSYGWC